MSRLETPIWGEFRMTWRVTGSSGSWQATCPHHQDISKTRCTRTRACRAGKDVLTGLKLLCLSWAARPDKDSHQGEAGADLHSAVTEEDLAEEREGKS